ncbi:cardiolipin synthase [Fructilactobacillus sp. Tb1]|uniref:cardiolipin synthase n=1 Tax=Fructilactobacillus sp. Tb1 TaxID=3422304 RepID=UPI003D26642F
MGTLTIILYGLLLVVFINTIIAIITIFREPRDIMSTLAWLMVLIFIPVLGFLLYGFFGRGIPKSQVLNIKGQTHKDVSTEINEQKQQLGKFDEQSNPNNKIVNDAAEQVKMFMNNDLAPLQGSNEIEVFTGGDTFVNQLFTDIDNAKSSINIEFYTFASDKIGTKALNVLVAAAKRGVDVKVSYDAWGSMSTHEQFFKPLFEAGGHAYPFLHNKNNILDMRVNYRDHHKLITIDGKIGYIGGLNLGDQYMGWDPKFGNWRDCMIRVKGHGVYGMQSKFIPDWNATAPKNRIDFNSPTEMKKYYPENATDGKAIMQIVSSGPISEKQQIKKGYIKLIQSAKHSIKLTTPYLIPDPSVIDALTIAAESGVDIQIITPDMPDHPFVYRATQWYTRQLIDLGCKVYAYNDGFMHAKTMVVDDKLVSIGSANFDYRSFSLNFECNAFVYDKKLAKEMEEIFKVDLENATQRTKEYFENEGWWLNFKQHFSRLMSPLM